MKKICPECGVEFEDDDWRRKYCSDKCFKEARTKRQRERYYRLREDPEFMELQRLNSRQYYQKHKTHIRERDRKRRQAHKERYREYKRRYYLKHKDEIKERNQLRKAGRKQRACAAAHDNCFSCPTSDGECPYD